MGVNDRARDKKDAAGKKALEARKRRANANGTGEAADWASVDGTILSKAVACVSRNGGAIRLGYTRDGGAYAVGFYGDGDPFTEYIPPTQNIDEYLKGVIEDYGR